MVRQPVRARVQLEVAEPLVREHQRRGIGRARHLGLEQLVDAAIPRVGHRGVVPLHQQPVALRIAQDVVRMNQPGRVGRDGPQQAREVVRHPPDRLGLVQVRVVLDPDREPVRPLLCGEAQVVPRRVVVRLHRQLRLEPVEPEPRPRVRVLQHEDDLEQRRDGGIALQAQRRHQAVERQVLVRQRVAHAAAHPIHQRGEARITGKVRAQRQHIDEEASDARQVRVGPVRRRRPDDDVLLPAVARHQQVEGREQHREQGRAPGPRQRVQRLRHVPVHRHVMVPAVVAHDRWARVVRRQLETRGAGQNIAPVLQLERQYLVREPRPLPRRDVRKLHPELRQRRCPPRHRRPVQLPQLAHQQVHRPAVAQDVMLDEDEDVRSRAR